MTSLVEAALARREPEWRAADLERELRGLLSSQRRCPKGRWVSARKIAAQAQALWLAGCGVTVIARAVHAPEKTVRKALALVSR